MGDDIKSLEYSKRAYDINSAMGLKEKAAVRLSQMAAAQIALKQYDEARQSLIKALPILKSAGNLQSWAISCNQLGDIYLQEGDNTSAASYYKSALEVFIGKGDAYNMSHSYQGLSEALIKTDPAPAAEYLKHYIQIKDSLYDSEMLVFDTRELLLSPVFAFICLLRLALLVYNESATACKSTLCPVFIRSWT